MPKYTVEIRTKSHSDYDELRDELQRRGARKEDVTFVGRNGQITAAIVECEEDCMAYARLLWNVNKYGLRQ